VLGVFGWFVRPWGILAANFDVCFFHRVTTGRIPTLFKILLMRLNWKAPIERRIPKL
jgi:hypothetical protein